MALAVFNQFPQLTRFFAQLARAAAHKETARRIVRLDLSKGRATLVDHAANLAALDGSAAVFALPDLVPGEARRFDLRLDVAAETAVTFEGYEDFELDAADTGAAVTKLERGVAVTFPTAAKSFCMFYKTWETTRMRGHGMSVNCFSFLYKHDKWFGRAVVRGVLPSSLPLRCLGSPGSSGGPGLTPSAKRGAPLE